MLDVNEAASRMLGYSKDELCAMTVHDLNPDFQADMWPGFWAETRKRGTMVFETFHKAKNGRLIPIEVSVNFLSYEGKEYHCAFVRDITERKRGGGTRSPRVKHGFARWCHQPSRGGLSLCLRFRLDDGVVSATGSRISAAIQPRISSQSRPILLTA